MKLPRVLLLTDRHQLPPGRVLADTVAACAATGLEVVVLRELDLPDRQRRALAEAVAAAGVTVISSRRWLAGVPGVHLSAAQTVDDAGPARFHGRSCHDEQQVRRAVAAGASYLTVSPVAPSPSKPGHGPPLGTVGVRGAVRAAGEVPVYALGGVDADNAGVMTRAGAHGVAVMGALMRAEDPGAVFSRIAEAVR